MTPGLSNAQGGTKRKKKPGENRLDYQKKGGGTTTKRVALARSWRHWIFATIAKPLRCTLVNVSEMLGRSARISGCAKMLRNTVYRRKAVIPTLVDRVIHKWDNWVRVKPGVTYYSKCMSSIFSDKR